MVPWVAFTFLLLWIMLWTLKVKVKSLSRVDPMDCRLPGPSVHGIFRARILEWLAISLSRGSSQPRDQTQDSRIAGKRFTIWATREVTMNIECIVQISVWVLAFSSFTYIPSSHEISGSYDNSVFNFMWNCHTVFHRGCTILHCFNLKLYLPRVLIAQSCPTLCNPVDCSPPGSSVHGIFQARILESLPFPSLEDLPDPGIEPWSPALQADSILTEISRKPLCQIKSDD